MKRLLGLLLFLCAAGACAAAPGYKITILNQDAPGVGYRPEYEPVEKLAGKTIAAIFGPISEVRVELAGIDKAYSDGDSSKVEEAIRERIDRAACLGRDSEIDWHRAPWGRGYILFENGRILPVNILLDAVIVGDLFFVEKVKTE